MNRIKIFLAVAVSISALTACDSGNKNNTEASASASTSEASSEAPAAAISFVDTQTGAPLAISAALFDTPAAKEFLATGKNRYIGDKTAEAKGKKTFGLYSCTQCHGGDANGSIGPGLHGPEFKYAKNATNKGMFETIWHGTANGMGGKGKGLMSPGDASAGLTPDEVLVTIAYLRSLGKISGN